MNLHVDCHHLSSSESGLEWEVRLIVMEHVPGMPLYDLWPADITQSERQEIFKAIVDLETDMYTCDVHYRIVFPVNVLLQDRQSAPGGSDCDCQSAMILDFSLSNPNRGTTPRQEEVFLPGVYISPLLRWAGPRIEPQYWFERWMDWYWGDWIEKTYKQDEPSITEYMRKTWGRRT